MGGRNKREEGKLEEEWRERGSKTVTFFSNSECHANNQRMELECHQSTMTSTKKQEEIRKSFMYNFEILEFILTELQMIFYESFNLASIPDGLSAMKLLTVLFSMCE